MTQTKSGKEVGEHFKIDDKPSRYPLFNIAPRDILRNPKHFLTPVVRLNSSTARREFAELEWGFVMKDTPNGARRFNAKSETAFDKWPWKKAIRNQRCLIGYFGTTPRKGSFQMLGGVLKLVGRTAG